jgi:hypothetical protein
MKTAFFALAFAFLPPQADSLTVQFAKGTKLTKSFSLTIDLDLDEVSLHIGERESPPELLEKVEMTMSFGNQYEVEDEYLAVEASRPTELVRRFTKATESNKQHFVMPPSDPKDEDNTVESPLVDHSVSFTWDAKEQKYERAFRGKEGEKAWLEKLEEEMDFERLLPPEKVEVGDTWKIDGKSFEAISSPGGSLAFPTKKEHKTDPLEDGLKGTIEARYDGKREVGGHTLAVIHVAGELQGGMDEDGEDSQQTKVALELEIEGEYLWDMEHGRLASFELAGPAKLHLTNSKEIEARGQKVKMLMQFALSGECKAAGRVE